MDEILTIQEAKPAQRSDRFLRPPSELRPNMTEHQDGYVASRENIQVIGDLQIRVVIEASTSAFIGIAYHRGDHWYSTMGFCYVGNYKSWEDALTNILVAYYG
jgi:hypothetical protein